MVKCNSPGCSKQVLYGPKNGSKLTCIIHKLENYIDLTKKICEFATCNIIATQGIELNKPLACKVHAKSNYTNVTHKKCEYNGCQVLASYSLIKGKKTHCVTHKSELMFDTTHKICEFKDCKIHASFSLIKNKPQFCSIHALDNMTNVCAKKCLSCDRQPTFGLIGQSPIYCFNHKLEHMLNVKDKNCQHPNCTTRPNFNKKGEKNGIYCKLHALPNMVDVTHKPCQFEKCLTRPNYGIIKATHCSEHKTSDMKSFNNNCSKCNTIHATFGNKNEKATHCFKCKESGMVDVKHTICNDCNLRAHYNYPGYSVEYCGKHKKPNMIANPKNKPATKLTCPICCCEIHYEDVICKSCQTAITNEATVKTLRKEIIIKNLLEREKFVFTHDKKLQDTCTDNKRRPDFIFTNTNGDIIILEVDEFQHRHGKSTTPDCELTRMKSIYHDLEIDNLKMLFIRYNPDKFKGSKISDADRQTYLVKYLKEQMSNKLQHHLASVYLFYDDFNKSNIKTHIIDPYVGKLSTVEEDIESEDIEDYESETDDESDEDYEIDRDETEDIYQRISNLKI